MNPLQLVDSLLEDRKTCWGYWVGNNGDIIEVEDFGGHAEKAITYLKTDATPDATPDEDEDPDAAGQNSSDKAYGQMMGLSFARLVVNRHSSFLFVEHRARNWDGLSKAQRSAIEYIALERGLKIYLNSKPVDGKDYRPPGFVGEARRGVNTMYGYWVGSDGKIMPVEGVCDHVGVAEKFLMQVSAYEKSPSTNVVYAAMEKRGFARISIVAMHGVMHVDMVENWYNLPRAQKQAIEDIAAEGELQVKINGRPVEDMDFRFLTTSRLGEVLYGSRLKLKAVQGELDAVLSKNTREGEHPFRVTFPWANGGDQAYAHVPLKKEDADLIIAGKTPTTLVDQLYFFGIDLEDGISLV